MRQTWPKSWSCQGVNAGLEPLATCKAIGNLFFINDSLTLVHAIICMFSCLMKNIILPKWPFTRLLSKVGDVWPSFVTLVYFLHVHLMTYFDTYLDSYCNLQEHFLLLLLIFMLVHTKESVTGLFMKPVYFVTLIEEFFCTSIAKYIP
jgi:hypothetical protein